jgi:hypothetical protein
MLHGGDQDDNGSKIYLPPQETDGGRRGPFPAAIVLAAEAQARMIFIRKALRTTSRLAWVIGAV